MITDGASENTEPSQVLDESCVKWEVKQEVDDVDSQDDWREDCLINDQVAGNADIDNVKKEEAEENVEQVPTCHGEKNVVKKNDYINERSRTTKRKAAPVSFQEEESSESEQENGNKSTFIQKKQKRRKDDDWDESIKYSSRKKNATRRTRRTRPSAKNRSPPEELVDTFGDFEDDFESEVGNGEKSACKKPFKKKQNDKDWEESEEYYVERKNASRCEGNNKRRNCSLPKMPEVFASMEEFQDYMDKRVESSISEAINEDEDPRVHQHFYLAVHECVQVGLRQGLVSSQEADDIWKRYDAMAGQNYNESRVNPSESLKKKRQRFVNRKYVRVEKVRLKEQEYQDMVRKTRRLKTSAVRDFVLKSIEENNGDNKIINDLKVRRDFFEMLLDVPGSNSKIAVLSSIKTLWKHLVYGKKEDWSKYLTNKKRVLEKRRELMDPENVKMRRYLYRQAYVASLPKEEIQRRSREKAEYFRQKRKAMDEDKRKELREKNRQWRMNLSGEKREKYIERVYSAIRKRNERLKYERAGLKPPDELLPQRKGRYSNESGKSGGDGEQGSKSDKKELSSTTNEKNIVGKGRGRGARAPRRFGICHKRPAPDTAPSQLVEPSPHYHDFTRASAPRQGVVGQQQQQPYHHCDSFPPVSSAISESNHSASVSVVASQLPTPPHNYSIRDRHQQQVSLQESPLHEHDDTYEHGGDSFPSSPPQNYPDEPETFSAVNPTVVPTVKHESQVDVSTESGQKISSDDTTSTALLGSLEICEECGMQFARSYDLRKHITFAHGEDESNRLCPMCGKEFNLPRSLWRHIVRHHGGMNDANKQSLPKPTRVYHGPCKCEVCGKEFLTGDMRKAYRDHMRRTHANKDKPTRAATTHIPSESFPNESRPKMTSCEKCGKEMLFISLKRHMQSVHPVDDAKSFACQECGKTFKDQRYLQDHFRLTHNFNFWKMIESRNLLNTSYSKADPGKEVFTCNICSENISERLQFRTHMLKKHPDVFKEISSTGAAYSNRECEVCKAMFPKEIELRQHLTSEHPDMCWNCPHCAKFICSQTSLHKHIKNIHSKNKKSKEIANEEPIGRKCPKCGDMIEGGEAELWTHIKTMHSEIIVYCKYCNKPKWSKRLLSDHQRICKLKPAEREEKKEEDISVEEESVNKVVCSVCGAKLKHCDSLNRHMKQVHKVHKTVFKCEEPECKQVFTNKTRLYNHLEEDHGNAVKRWRKKKTRCNNKKETETFEIVVKRRVSNRKSITKSIDAQVTLDRFSEKHVSLYLKTESE